MGNICPLLDELNVRDIIEQNTSNLFSFVEYFNVLMVNYTADKTLEHSQDKSFLKCCASNVILSLVQDGAKHYATTN